MIPLILLLFNERGEAKKYFWAMVGIYLIAKFFEHGDEPVLKVTGFISGHSIKHLVAAIAPLVYLAHLHKKTDPAYSAAK